jgi:phage terminase large subunit-like protein
MRHVAGETIAALVADRYKQSELTEAAQAASIRVPIIWRGFGFRDGGEDCSRFQRACADGKVKSSPSLLLRSAFGDAVVLRDPAGNMKLAKARSRGRIDAASAAVIAVAEGSRRAARATKNARSLWV